MQKMTDPALHSVIRTRKGNSTAMNRSQAIAVRVKTLDVKHITKEKMYIQYNLTLVNGTLSLKFFHQEPIFLQRDSVLLLDTIEHKSIAGIKRQYLFYLLVSERTAFIPDPISIFDYRHNVHLTNMLSLASEPIRLNSPKHCFVELLFL